MTWKRSLGSFTTAPVHTGSTSKGYLLHFSGAGSGILPPRSGGHLEPCGPEVAVSGNGTSSRLGCSPGHDADRQT
jgi:hypothetical protein